MAAQANKISDPEGSALGGDVNTVDVKEGSDEGLTTLHRAAALGQTKRIRELLQGGADVNTLDSSGKTPLDYSVGHQRAEYVLRKAGGKKAKELFEAEITSEPLAHGGNDEARVAEWRAQSGEFVLRKAGEERKELKAVKARLASDRAFAEATVSRKGDNLIHWIPRLTTEEIAEAFATACSLLEVGNSENREKATVEQPKATIAITGTKDKSSHMPKAPIIGFKLLVEPDPGRQSLIATFGEDRIVSTGAPRQFLVDADEALRLNGDLLRWAEQGYKYKYITPLKNDQERKAFLEKEFVTFWWEAYTRGTESGMYFTIVVLRNKQEKEGISDASARLLQAAFRGDFEECVRLIDSGANVNAANEEGTTPLHAAVSSRNKEIFCLLLSRGADVNVATKNGITPLDLAQGKVSGLEPNAALSFMLLKRVQTRN